MQPLSHPPDDALSLERIFHALGDPARLTIFRRIARGDGLACGEVCAVMPRSTLSVHTRILRDAGLIRSERRGKSVISRVRAEALEARFPGLLNLALTAPAVTFD
ncbi:metalloregulator ArsR/SmtB family transcription factor [Brevundimonas sp.]|jgi:DNA-binding transcriptional ArsR family regulator|uniref:ArsR/SmtB family transcription factor n=1 Tax=Brevundimonas sp. TaxID=1871086 RepID=UPI002E10B5AB|nr:metalloregulator ArsR/SmtB family transcription factor [Brevundimonas sp.]